MAVARGRVWSGAQAKEALKSALSLLPGEWPAWLAWLLPAAAVGTTLLMARFLVVMAAEAPGPKRGAALPWLAAYGAHSPAEFFAVACEAYWVAPAAFAQSPDETQQPEEGDSLETVVVTGTRTTVGVAGYSTPDSTKSRGVIGQELIERQGAGQAEVKHGHESALAGRDLVESLLLVGSFAKERKQPRQ